MAGVQVVLIDSEPEAPPDEHDASELDYKLAPCVTDLDDILAALRSARDGLVDRYAE